MASIFVKELDDRVLECAICMNRFNRPKTLPCLHSFCQKCLKDWVEKNNQLSCPTCMDNFEIPDGGLESIPPNTFVNNLLEYVDHLEGGELMCSYCTLAAVKFCKDCSQNFCATCVKSHSEVDVLKSHTLYTDDELRKLTLEQRQLLSMHCKNHTDQSLKFYCNTCKEAICVECIIIEHKTCHITDNVVKILDAFEVFKKTAAELIDEGEKRETKIQEEKLKRKKKADQLKLERSFCEQRINRSVDEAILKLQEERKQLIDSLQTMYDGKKVPVLKMIDQFDAASNDFVHIKQLVHLSVNNSNPATALDAKDQLLDKLKKTVHSYPTVEEQVNGALLHFEETQSLKKSIGHVTETLEVHKLFEIRKQDENIIVTKNQPFFVEIATPILEKVEDISAYLITVSGKQETPVVFQYHENGIYRAECSCSELSELHVKFNDVLIKGSPSVICVENDGLVRTIRDFENIEFENQHGKATDVMTDDGYLLVSMNSREVLKFDSKTGKHVDTINMPPKCHVYMMCRAKADGLIIYSDSRNKCVTVCENDGTTIRSFGKGFLTFAAGLALDECTRTLYVVDRTAHCVVKFNFDNGEFLEKIISNNEGEFYFNRPYRAAMLGNGIVITDCRNNRLQLLDKNTNVVTVLVKHIDNDINLKCPLGLVVDDDGNIIVSGHGMLQVFNGDGEFVRRIDTGNDNLNIPCGLAVVSYRPRRVAVANYGNSCVKIYNY
ncbi:tripartite motif-containing protein 2-like [Antedon mediterranea]|uniref:tripartite motif-containing protein 2-like n=1 Tax=Antedon mediterranea TaxID=105859 RepID=UPI003AF501B4